MPRWRKLGLLYNPVSVHPKLATHAANPLPIQVDGDHYRVLFSGRDSQNRSSVGYVEVDMRKYETTYVHKEPIFTHGPEGTYYSHGVSVGNIYTCRGRRYVGFMGWNVSPNQHWSGTIGRLAVADDLSLSLDGDVPLLGTSSTDPVSLSYPWIEREGAEYRMWYGSTITWDAGNNEMIHSINLATSKDGNDWNPQGIAVPYRLGTAQAFSRPTVARRSDGAYEMWFSYRGGNGQKYKIGYATSTSGKNWVLSMNDAGIDLSEAGWDSEMIEYPYVFDHKGGRFMLYNGNGYGSTGFGLAVLEP